MGDQNLMKSFDVEGNWPSIQKLEIGGQNKISDTSMKNDSRVIRSSSGAPSPRVSSSEIRPDTPNSARKTLRRDFKLIQREPLPTVSAHPLVSQEVSFSQLLFFGANTIRKMTISFGIVIWRVQKGLHMRVLSFTFNYTSRKTFQTLHRVDQSSPLCRIHTLLKAESVWIF